MPGDSKGNVPFSGKSSQVVVPDGSVEVGFLVAAGRVVGGSGLPRFIVGASVGRDSLGVYTITLDDDQSDPDERVTHLTVDTPADRTLVIQTNATGLIRIQARVAGGGLADTDFLFSVFRAV
jgi:hypothetical protein